MTLMADIASDHIRPGAPSVASRGRAAGIYGAIITAAVFAAAGAKLPTRALAVSVLVTLVVYWVAEEYAHVVGEQVTGGHLPSWASIRRGLGTTWPMVSASYLPIVALVLARLVGASPSAAANVGLVAAVVLLTFHGWSAARAARLRGLPLIGATSIAAALGLIMVVLKNVVLLRLH
jgi:hypothetical protein